MDIVTLTIMLHNFKMDICTKICFVLVITGPTEKTVIEPELKSRIEKQSMKQV